MNRNDKFRDYNKSNKSNKGRGRGKGGNNSKNRGGSRTPNPKEEEKFFEQRTGQPASLYFTDARLAEDNTYVSNRTVLDTAAPIYGSSLYYPTIITYAMNPSLGVSLYDDVRGVNRNSAVQQAATKLLTMIIANTGRVQNYTKWDLIVLIAAIGEYVSMTEYARRTIGLIYKYQEINRDIPRQFVEACGIDFDDLIANLDNYVSEINAYIDMAAQIVIPMDKIRYLKQCRDIYQKVYQDADGDGDLIYHMMVPYSTWHLEEDTDLGSILRTVNVTGFHDDIANGINGKLAIMRSNVGSITNNDPTESISRNQPHTIWTFGEFLDKVYKPLVLKLLNSATFNTIYSDLRSTKFQSAYSFEFWKADPIFKDYATPIEFDASLGNIFHNMRTLGVPCDPLGFRFTDTAGAVHPVFTAYNDAVHDPAKDEVVYNPAFMFGCNALDTWVAANENSGGFASVSIVDNDDFDVILDFTDYHPSLDYRVDAMAYNWTQVLNPTLGVSSGWNNHFKRFGNTNYILPPHYCVGRYTYVYGTVNARYSQSSNTTPADYDKQFNNGWMPIDDENVIYYPWDKTAGSTTIGIYYWDDTNSAETQWMPGGVPHYYSFFKYGATPNSLTVRLTYVNYISIGRRVERVANPVVSDHSFRKLISYTNCNVDNWFITPAIKFVNMFRHIYQTLWTADNIMQ